MEFFKVTEICSCLNIIYLGTHQIVDAVIRECKKENMEYKMEGIKAVGPILEAHNLDRFQEIHDILYPHVKQVNQQSQPQHEHL